MWQLWRFHFTQTALLMADENGTPTPVLFIFLNLPYFTTSMSQNLFVRLLSPIMCSQASEIILAHSHAINYFAFLCINVIKEQKTIWGGSGEMTQWLRHLLWPRPQVWAPIRGSSQLPVPLTSWYCPHSSAFCEHLHSDMHICQHTNTYTHH